METRRAHTRPAPAVLPSAEVRHPVRHRPPIGRPKRDERAPSQCGRSLNELPDARGCAHESQQRTSLTAPPLLRLPAALPGSARFGGCSFFRGTSHGARLLHGTAFGPRPEERPQCETLLHDEVTATGALLRSPLTGHGVIIANTCSCRQAHRLIAHRSLWGHRSSPPGSLAPRPHRRCR